MRFHLLKIVFILNDFFFQKKLTNYLITLIINYLKIIFIKITLSYL